MTMFYEPPPSAYEVVSSVVNHLALIYRVKITFTIETEDSTCTETVDRKYSPPTRAWINAQAIAVGDSAGEAKT